MRGISSRDDHFLRIWTSDQVWSLLVWLLPAVAVLFSRMPVNDLAYQIRAGTLMLEHGHVLRTDPFTFTVLGQPWLDQQWGSQLLLNLAFRPGGWSGLVVVRAAIVAVGFGVVFAWTRRASGNVIVAAGLTLAALVVTMLMPGTLALRPQLLAVPLLLVAIWILRRRAQHPWGLAWLPVVTVLWANLHGSFVLMPMLCGIAFVADVAARRSWRRTGAATLACFLAAAVNPWGFEIYGYVGDLATNPIVRDVIDEWRPLWRLSPAGPAVLVAVVVLVTMFATGILRRPTLEEGLGLATFVALAVLSGRSLLWACLYVPPVVGGMTVARPERPQERSPLAVVVSGLLVALLLLGVGRVLTAHPPETLLSEAPRGITIELERIASPDDRVFDGWWGSWFEFSIPHIPMFVDARAELFPQRVWDDFFTISDASGPWRNAVERWEIDIIVASHDHQRGLLTALGSESGWTEVYRDGDGVIFERSEG
ncbi:MAG: hypothetical protein ACR2M2_08365 [Gaiellaceae bacterium]